MKRAKTIFTVKKPFFQSLLVVLLSGAILLWQYRTSLHSRLSSSQDSTLQSELLSESANAKMTTVPFAGLAGSPPQFIEEGPDKGFGWAEYETYPIRRALAEQGLILKQEWMTPARIAHEFRVGNPICTYPVKWQDPKKTFASKPSRIYSIPISLAGNETRKLLFRTADLPKFKKHYDAKGDLNITSLLQDKTLKTLLVRDQDYGDLGSEILDRDASGDQFVRKQVSDHVILLLIKENRQLIEMLNAGRFDYIFADAIEEQDFKLTGIQKDQFTEVAYQTGKIAIDIRDPRLTLVSIACSTHPLSLKLIPAINEKIARSRNRDRYREISHYRSRIDPKYEQNIEGVEFLNVTQFNGIFDAGGADYWYPEQQRHFPNLRLFPLPRPQPILKPFSRERSPLRWRAISEQIGALTLLNEASPDYRKLRKNPDGRSFHGIPYPIPFYERYLSPSQKSLYFNPDLLFSPHETVTSFRNLNLNRSDPVKKLTLFASGLTSKDLEILAPLFPELKELTVFGAGTKETTFLVKLLPQKLEHLRLINCSLSQSDIETKIRGMPLKTLHLTASQVTQRQMGTLISNIPSSITELSLAFHRGAFSRKAAKAFETQSWPQLKYLDLENCVLFDEHLDSLSRAIPASIETLRLGQNFFYPMGLRRFQLQRFSKLQELDLSYSVVGSTLPDQLILPSQLKRLYLWNTQLIPDNLRKIKMPDSLEILDLSQNFLEDEAIADFLPHLSQNVKYLDLSSTHAGTKTLRFLSTPGRFKKIEELRLDSNSLDDAQISVLSQADLQIDSISLRENRIHNSGAGAIASGLLPRLKALDLSRNPITLEGVVALARNIPKDLLELSLEGLAALSVEALAPSLPKGLLKLDLSQNQISDAEMKQLAPSLPPTLKDLQLFQSEFTSEGSWHLARHLPPKLTLLGLRGTPIGQEGLRLISSALPSTLKDLRMGPLPVDSSGIKTLADQLPPQLLVLHLSKVSTPSDDLSHLLSRLPNSLSTLVLLSTPVSIDSLSQLSSHWPGNMRQLYFAGTVLGDQKIEALSHNLPPSLERLGLVGVGIGDRGVTKIGENALENFHLLEWAGGQFTSPVLNSFLLKHSAIWYIYIPGSLQMKNGFLSELPRERTEMIREMSIDGLPLSDRGIIELFKKLNPNFRAIGAQSINLNPSRIEEFIRVLPTSLITLSLKGVPLGEKARIRLRQHAEDQERKTGLQLSLEE